MTLQTCRVCLSVGDEVGFKRGSICSKCYGKRRRDRSRANVELQRAKLAPILARDPSNGQECRRCRKLRHASEFPKFGNCVQYCATCRIDMALERAQMRRQLAIGSPEDDAEIARDLAAMRDIHCRIRDARVNGDPTGKLEQVAKAIRDRLRIGDMKDALCNVQGPSAGRKPGKWDVDEDD